MSLLTGMNALDHDVTRLFMKLWTPNFDINKHLCDFQSLETVSKKIDSIYNDLKKYEMFYAFFNDTKSDECSKNIRDHGNLMYKTGNYPLAYSDYTKAILVGETRKTLSLAYANRSMVLFKSEMYQQCVLDIDRALNLDYPHNLRRKLLTRKTEANSKIQPLPRYHEPIPDITENIENDKIKYATNAVEIVENHPKFGKHLIATRNLNMGDLLAVEKPFVVTPSTTGSQDARLDHCDFCNELCFTLIPCERCTEAMYCGAECKNTAFDHYHKYECAIFKTLGRFIPKDVNVHFIVALRIAFRLRDKYEEVIKTFINTRSDFHASDYCEIFNLRSCAAYTLPEKQFQIAMIIAQIFHLVKTRTSFFGDFPDSHCEDVFKEILFRIVLISNVNTREVKEAVDATSINVISHGLYALAGLFARSCTANVSIVSYGNTTVMRAVKPIMKGESCLADCGTVMPIQMELFRNFNYVCSCYLCTSTWTPETLMSASFAKGVQMKNYLMSAASNLEQVKKLIRSFGNQQEKIDPKDRLHFVVSSCIFDGFVMLGNNRQIAPCISPF